MITLSHSENEKTNVTIHTDTYKNNGTLAVWAEDDEGPYVNISVNVENFSDGLGEDLFFGKDYSENEGILEQLEAQNVIKIHKNMRIPVGYGSAVLCSLLK